MITTTPPRTLRPRNRQRRAGRRAFTLVEVMISATLAAFILAGTLSTFLFLGRSGANIRNYSDMESQARKGLEYSPRTFGRLVRFPGGRVQITLTVNSA